MSDLIQTLAQRRVSRKSAGVEPYVLILGAGASISSGCPSYAELVDVFLRDNCPADFTRLDHKRGAVARREAKLKRFYEEWSGLSKPNRFSFLKTHLSCKPSSGYEHLAWMARRGYIRLILSTNIDQLVEDAFTAAKLVPKTDYDIVVNGPEKANEVARLMPAQNPAVKLVKLHGTLADEESYAWLPREVFAFMRGLGDALEPHLNSDVVILGHAMNDRNLESLFWQAGGEVWFVNPSGGKGSRFEPVLSVRPQSRAIVGELACFDRFMERLRVSIDAAEVGSGTVASAPAILLFLKAIGMPEQINEPRSRYLHLPDLYVKPREYDQILRTLDKQHAVVIAGEPHMGKTYTALHILWERFQQDWSVKHMRREALAWELQNCRQSTDEFAARHLGPKCLVHLDDPFGEIEYQPLGALQKEFAHLIQDTQRRKDCGLIVTSRLGVFSEAFRNMEGADLLRAMGVEADIRVHTSYSEDTLREILARYLALYEPSWASNGDLKQLVFRHVPRVIEAPHNIELFARTSQGLRTQQELLDCARECREIVPALRDWILRLPLEEQLVLLLVGNFQEDRYAYGRVRPADLREIHRGALADAYRHRLVEGIRGAAWESGLENLRGVVDLSGEDARSRLSFVHPSYVEALHEALKRSPLLRDLLLAAARFAARRGNSEALRVAAASAVPRHAHLLGEDGAALLQQLKRDRSLRVRENLAEQLARSFHFQECAGRKIIAALATDPRVMVRHALAFWLAANYHDLDASGCKLVEGLARDPSAGVRVGLAHALPFLGAPLSASAQRTLRLLTNDPVRWIRSELVLGLVEVYGGLDASWRQAVLRLARDTDAAVTRDASFVLASGYGKLDASGRREVAALAKDTDVSVRGQVALGLAVSWRKVGVQGRRLARVLARDGNPRVRARLARGLAYWWTDLDAPGRGLMIALAQDRSPYVRASLANGLVSMQYGNLDASGHSLVAALAQDSAIGVRRSLAEGLAQSREPLDAHGRRLLADLEKRLRKEAGGTIKQAGAQKRKTSRRGSR
jgi:hypothetical protein